MTKPDAAGKGAEDDDNDGDDDDDVEEAEFPKAKVLFDYAARSETELTAHAGDIVLIVSQDNPDWWEAEKDGDVGFLPRNFVELLPDEPLKIALNKSDAGASAGARKRDDESKPADADSQGDDSGSDDGSSDDSDDQPVLAPPARSAPPPPAEATNSGGNSALAAIAAVEQLVDEPPESMSAAELREQHALLAAAALRVCRELRQKLAK